MKEIKKSIAMLLYNGGTFVRFELFYKIITLVIVSPLFAKAFQLTMKITGYTYLTYENIIRFILNPLTLVLLLALVLLLLAYTLFDITAIVIILDQSYHKEKITVPEAIAVSLSKAGKLLRIKNISLAFFVLVMIPFLNFGLASGFVSSLNIPEFISDYIADNSTLSLAFVIAVSVLFFLLIRWIYSLHYIILENKNFKEARKCSANLIKKNYIKDCAVFVLMSAVCTLLYLLLLFAGIFLIYVISSVLNKFTVIKSIAAAVVWIFLAISLIAFTLLSLPISYAIISAMFYKHKSEKNEKTVEVTYDKKERKNFYGRRLRRLKSVLALGVLIAGTVFTYGLYKGTYNLNIEYVRTMEITAHRGASAEYPENTMEAFIGAKELGADWIELDVQQTKDGQIIVIHDTNLKRTTGVDKNTWEVTYEEIKDLDAGSFLDSKFSDARIPLLEEVISWAKENNMKLNIELKPTGYETDFEKTVVDLITAYQFEEDCVITSQVYEVLENVKKAGESVQTVYVMSLAYGNITELEQADHFSIEATSVNQTLVSKVHNAGKQLYVWTVNTKENMEKMIDLKVDNIITDNITLAKNTVYESKNSNLINEFIKLVDNLLS